MTLVQKSGAGMSKKHAPADGWVYILKSGDFYKIGRSKGVRARVTNLQTASPHRIDLYLAIQTDDMASDEKLYHDLFSKHHHLREWFALDSSALAQLVEWMMVSPVPLVGDCGDEGNYNTYMTEDFTVRRQIRPVNRAFGDCDYIPNGSINEGMYLADYPTRCSCMGLDSYEPIPACLVCKGYGAIILHSATYRTAAIVPDMFNSRPYTENERYCVKLYQDWIEEDEVCYSINQPVAEEEEDSDSCVCDLCSIEFMAVNGELHCQSCIAGILFTE